MDMKYYIKMSIVWIVGVTLGLSFIVASINLSDKNTRRTADELVKIQQAQFNLEQACNMNGGTIRRELNSNVYSYCDFNK